MSPVNLPLGPDEFAQGVVYYSDYDPTQRHSRIIIPVTFGTLHTSAIVDTGSPWCILGPDEATELNLNAYESFVTPPLIIRSGRFSGTLYRIPVSVEAIQGERTTLNAKVFIPQLAPHQRWLLPNFIGLEGFLEQIRFAVDPFQNLFYFGTSS
jgi:hypothetical protein